MLKRHREDDARPDTEQARWEIQAAQAIKAKAGNIQRWLDEHDDKPGKGGKPRKSNLTDHGSVKMKTSKGVIQGCDGVACVDAKHQVIVHRGLWGGAGA